MLKKLLNHQLTHITIILFTSSWLCWNTLTLGHNWGDDFALYIMQAISIVENNIYSFLESSKFLIQESVIAPGPVASPWGFPLVLAPIYAYFKLNILALKSVNIIFFLLYIIVLWFGFQKKHSYVFLTCLVLLFAFNPYLISFLNNILPDIPFLFFSTLFLVILQKEIDQENILLSNKANQIILGIIVAMSFFIRTNGVLLLPTLTASQLIKIGLANPKNQSNPFCIKGFISYLFTNKIIYTLLLPYFSFLFLCLIWWFIFPESNISTISQFKKISLVSLINNTYHYLSAPARFFNGILYGHILYLLSIPFFLATLVLRIKYDYPIIIYLFLTFSLYILIPFDSPQGIRYLFPILPFYISFVLMYFENKQAFSNKKLTILLNKASILLVLSVVIYFLIISAQTALFNLQNQRVEISGVSTVNAKGVFSFVKENTPTKSIIIFFKPRAMKLFTKRQSITANNLDLVLAKGDYLCIYSGKYEYLKKELPKAEVQELKARNKLILVYTNSDFSLYQINKS